MFSYPSSRTEQWISSKYYTVSVAHCTYLLRLCALRFLRIYVLRYSGHFLPMYDALCSSSPPVCIEISPHLGVEIFRPFFADVRCIAFIPPYMCIETLPVILPMLTQSVWNFNSWNSISNPSIMSNNCSQRLYHCFSPVNDATLAIKPRLLSYIDHSTQTDQTDSEDRILFKGGRNVRVC